MLKAGLVSVTFRQLSPQQIISLCVEAGLSGIEWGGDIHVPHGDMARAVKVAEYTQGAGLEVVSYGSYYRADSDEAVPNTFTKVLETALALGAPSIRIWAGNKGSGQASVAYWNGVVETIRRDADQAGQVGISLCLEHHGNTLTDTAGSTLALLDAIHHPNVRTYWQPSFNQTPADRLEELSSLLPWLRHLHVFQWNGVERKPLEEGQEEWIPYLRTASAKGEHLGRYALLEFVQEDEPEYLLRDAKVLRGWIGKISESNNT
ncbi:3-dehydroshikimate dehydratase [Peptococcaceae bacterium CEB3]|nr:3-dehydroshikimate dehydratase [Peptococcaceae bacterium CEB3]